MATRRAPRSDELSSLRFEVLLPVLVYPLCRTRRAERALLIEAGASGLTLACQLPLWPAERVRVFAELGGRVVRLTAEVRSVEWLVRSREEIARGAVGGTGIASKPRPRFHYLCELKLDAESLASTSRQVYQRFLCGLMLGEPRDEPRAGADGWESARLAS